MTESNSTPPAQMTLVLAVCCPVCHFNLVSVRRLLADYSAELRGVLVTALLAEGEGALANHLRWTHQMDVDSPAPEPVKEDEPDLKDGQRVRIIGVDHSGSDEAIGCVGRILYARGPYAYWVYVEGWTTSDGAPQGTTFPRESLQPVNA